MIMSVVAAKIWYLKKCTVGFYWATL